jgi:hypothetical protein
MTSEDGSGRSDDAEPSKAYDPQRARTEKSLGNISDEHWSRARKELHREEIEFLRERSQAPGVEGGGADRNHYCMECHGVIALAYDQREPSEGSSLEHCPHCGAELDTNVRMMFNWVEMDQPHGSDLRAIVPILAGVALLVVAVVAALIWLG